LSSFSEFNLAPATRAALAAMGIETPTPIQALALPHLLAGRDLIGQARTGSGKTLAFGIPLVERVDPRERAVQALVLAPTRELATQVGGVLEAVGKGRGLRVALIYGGRAFGPQESALRAGAQIVVGAPGRVLDLIRRGALRLDRVRYLVLDEADEMLDRGFAPDVERILAHAPRARQTALFSATVPPWVHETAGRHLNDPVTVQVDTRPEDVPKIEHVVYDVPEGTKLDVLKRLLDARGDGATIVFGRTKHGVKKLGRQLEGLGYPVAALQGNLSQNARDRVMADFRSGAVSILLATNVAARGIDVDTVEQVINFDLPESAELLTHRVGRTGRMGREGRAITLLGPEDAAKWRQLERAANRSLPRLRWRDEYAAAPPDTAALATARPERPAARPAVATDDAAARNRTGGRIVPLTERRQGSPGRAFPPAPRPAPAPVALHEQERVRHTIICSGCGREATIPFVPRTDRPVYCRDCFRREPASEGRAVTTLATNRRDGGPRVSAPVRRGAR
jgi:ATP-dependent RNA helicase DeaD